MSDARYTEPADRPLRLVSPSVEEAIRRFDDPELLAAGKVNVISLEAIQSEIGARWSARRQQIGDFTARVLERGIGTDGYFLQVSDTDFFIVHPDLGKVAGQAACLRYLREIFAHFLGEDRLAAQGVLQVVRLSRGKVHAAPIDEQQMVSEIADLDLGITEAPSSPDPRPMLDQWTPFVANDGRRLRVSSALEPVYETKGFTRIGFRMVRRVIVTQTEHELSPGELTMLSTADLLRVDLATISRGIVRLSTEKEKQLSLVVPLSYSSLASAKGRVECARQLKTAQAAVRLGVICEVCDLEGAPPGALAAAITMVRPFALLVAGRLVATTPSAILQHRGAGLQAVSFECPLGLGDAAFMGWATGAVGAARRVAKSVLVYGVTASPRAGVLAALGASHVSLATAAAAN